MQKITIHQPQYLPWPGYFEKIINSDVFILLDDVQFQKNGLQNRNKIKTSQGEAWLTLPIKHAFGQLIKDVVISNPRMKEKHVRSFQMNYKQAQYFQSIFEPIENVFMQESVYLSEISSNLIIKILELLDYDGKILYSSDIGVEGSGSDLVLNLCKALEAEQYLSGRGGLNYLDKSSFDKAGINVVFQNFKMPEYSQCFSKLGFIPDLSVIDLLFNEGNKSREIIDSGSNSYLEWNEVTTLK